MSVTILAIESSCDDTSASVIQDAIILSNVVSSQLEHKTHGGVIPELASRKHLNNIDLVIEESLQKAEIKIENLSAIAVTRGPGLLGSLLVGLSFAKGLAIRLGIPLIEVHHMQAHILAHFIDDPKPPFPFLCLTVSGGHTQIVRVDDYFDMTILGQTLDDAAGEAFDKVGKMIGLPYPAGPIIDRLAKAGKDKFTFATADVPGYNYSFSGLKTSVLYYLHNNINDICASLQANIVQALMAKLTKASEDTGIRHIGIAGGVSANSGLRLRLNQMAQSVGWNVYTPALKYTTDNAAMIAIAGHYKYIQGDFSDLQMIPFAKGGF
ncbi:UNVERIFIED_CONTAM: hypothetical protein GTU68_036446 [Idotea baltica]|nr:hypothetical protein [Idotea baltica]